MLENPGQGWLSSIFGSGNVQKHHKRTSSREIQEATGLDLSLAQAFVAFLQEESTPQKPPLKLPEPENALNTSSTSSGRSTPTSAMPTIGVVNPNFSQEQSQRSASASPLLFASNTGFNRSSSAILRQVLQEDD